MGPPRFSLGIGLGVLDSPYAGEGLRYRALPLIQYQGEQVFFQGRSLGWRLARRDGFQLAAMASFRLSGFDVKDLGTRELAANGIDRRLLEDRKDSIDVGLSLEWESPVGDFTVMAMTDATGASKGQELSLEYSRPFNWAGMRIVPALGLSWMSKKMGNFYYGTLDNEVARGVVSYRPGSAVIPSLGVTVIRPFAGRWSLMGVLQYQALPGRYKDSPLIEAGERGRTSMLLGVVRAF